MDGSSSLKCSRTDEQLLLQSQGQAVSNLQDQHQGQVAKGQDQVELHNQELPSAGIHSETHMNQLLGDCQHGNGNDPMISMNNRDLNSPVMFMQMGDSHLNTALILDELQRDTITAMETGGCILV